MIISNVLNRLEPILVEIELNSVEINNHKSNANLANTAAALSYLFTNNSKNNTVRTVGQVATIGGLVYGSSQRNQAASIEAKNIILISQILDIVERDGINNIRQEIDTNYIRKFIELNLKTGKHLDLIVLAYLSKIKSKGRLGKRNINLLMHANNIDIFSFKIRLNKIYKSLEPNKQIPPIEQEFINDTSSINIEKITKEGLYTRLIIFSLLLIGFVSAQSFNYGSWFIIGGLIFWGINHYFPFFPETKKLKLAVDAFAQKINSTCGINSINYR
jgi:hypothetical protein